MTAWEEFQSGERMADVRIRAWISTWSIPEARLRANIALQELRPKTAPCLDGMIYAFKMFLR